MLSEYRVIERNEDKEEQRRPKTDTDLVIDLMHDDVTHSERQYGSCSHAQIQDGRQ